MAEAKTHSPQHYHLAEETLVWVLGDKTSKTTRRGESVPDRAVLRSDYQTLHDVRLYKKWIGITKPVVQHAKV